MRWPVIVAAVLAAVLPGVASAALDAPHDASFSDGVCNNCHALFTTSSTGGYNYSEGCKSCHAGKAATSGGFLWLDTAEAIPGAKGTSHSWSGAAENPTYGAASPSPAVMASRLLDGKLQCVTCHDPHTSDGQDPASQHTSIPVGTNVDESASGAATTAQMALVSAGNVAKGYRLKIQAGGTSFVISHDFGLASPTWLNWNGSAWIAGTDVGPGRPFTPGVAVATDDPLVTVRWTSAATAGAWWDFYVGYPFLRVTNTDDAICSSCHNQRFMTHVQTSGSDSNVKANGVRKFSHPVGVAMNASGQSYTRTAAVGPLDTNGLLQSAGDGRASNNLVLDGGIVRCTTCHAVHNADSNSLTDDVR